MCSSWPVLLEMRSVARSSSPDGAESVPSSADAVSIQRTT